MNFRAIKKWSLKLERFNPLMKSIVKFWGNKLVLTRNKYEFESWAGRAIIGNIFEKFVYRVCFSQQRKAERQKKVNIANSKYKWLFPVFHVNKQIATCTQFFNMCANRKLNLKQKCLEMFWTNFSITYTQ